MLKFKETTVKNHFIIAIFIIIGHNIMFSAVETTQKTDTVRTPVVQQWGMLQLSHNQVLLGQTPTCDG